MKIGSSVALGNTLKINNLVEAAGVEPAPPQNANWLMARDFRLSLLEIRCHVVDSLCSGVLSSALSAQESWRHSGDGRSTPLAMPPRAPYTEPHGSV